MVEMIIQTLVGWMISPMKMSSNKKVEFLDTFVLHMRNFSIFAATFQY